MKVVFSRGAQTDLRDITDYIAQHSPLRAKTFVRELRGRCKPLNAFPNAHPRVGRYHATEIRRLVHGNYLIFYQISSDHIYILRVLNGAMDFERVLFPETDGEA